MLLTNKNAIITGCNRGLGKQLLHTFALEGANIWAHARKKNEKFENEIYELSQKFNVRITPIYFDVTDSEEMKQTIKEIMKSKIPIDILVNNVGMAHGGLFQMTTIDTIREVFDVNFFAVLELTQLVAKLMIRKKSGSIVMISSNSGIELKNGNCAYGISKAAIIAATKTLAAEYTPLGIRINAVAPGLLDTDMKDLMEMKAYDEMVSNSCMNRLGTPEEVAKVVAFLASSDASFISGQTIKINGGV